MVTRLYNVTWIKSKASIRFNNILTLITSVGSEPKLGSARFWLELLEKKARLGSARHAFQKARLAISCKKSSVQLGLLYCLKNWVTLKNKNWADFQHFCQFFKVQSWRHQWKCVFSTKKLYSLKKSTENSQKLFNFKKLKARLWKQKAWLGLAQLGSARLAKK